MRERWWLGLTVAAGCGTVALGVTAVVLSSSVMEAPRPWYLDRDWAIAIVLIFGGALTWVALWRWRGAQNRRLREVIGRHEVWATRDPLTGLPNRRGFMEMLGLRIAKARHWEWPFAILVVDLDHSRRVLLQDSGQVGREIRERILDRVAVLHPQVVDVLVVLGWTPSTPTSWPVACCSLTHSTLFVPKESGHPKPS